MLETLRFVRGAVAKKDYVPALTHFCIHNKRVTGYNGRFALSAPIDCELDVLPKAEPFVRAIERCTTHDTSLTATANGKLVIKSGKFRAAIDCSTEPFTHPTHPTAVRECGMILDALRHLEPFISDDASRPWSRGVLFKGQSAYATNNVVLAQYWLDAPVVLPFNIPVGSVRELLRIGEEPDALAADETCATFYYSGERWLNTLLYSTEWPDVEGLLQQCFNGAENRPIPRELWEACEHLAPFVDALGRVYLYDGQARTVPTAAEGEGASYQMPPGMTGIFNVKHLSSLQGVALGADFARTTGQPVPWLGGRLRGVITGMRG